MPLSIYSRWSALFIASFAFVSALATTAASIIATAMFLIFSRVIEGAEDTVDIVPEIGVKMFAFMWVASACSVVAWLMQMGLCCCCASRRDVVKGRKKGRRKAWRENDEIPPYEINEKSKKRHIRDQKKQ